MALPLARSDSRPSHRAHKNYTGNVSFEEFARAYINGTHGFARVGRQAKMVHARPKQHGIDRIFRYERLDLLIEFLCEKIGEDVEVGRSNVSPEMPTSYPRIASASYARISPTSTGSMSRSPGAADDRPGLHLPLAVVMPLSWKNG